MSKLIVFGDSFTCLHNNKDNEHYYSKCKNNENDLLWSEIVAKKLDIKLHNFGYGSFSNYRIIDSIIENFDLIEAKDYEGIAEEIEKSKRLWEHKGLDGLVIRREAEADMIRNSIA